MKQTLIVLCCTPLLLAGLLEMRLAAQQSAQEPGAFARLQMEDSPGIAVVLTDAEGKPATTG